jgi:hypothetical protein
MRLRAELCLRLQRGCGVRAWGPDGLGTGGQGRGREGEEGVDVDYALAQSHHGAAVGPPSVTFLGGSPLASWTATHSGTLLTLNGDTWSDSAPRWYTPSADLTGS